MDLDLAPAPAVLWSENEKTGYRHVGVMSEGTKIFVVASHKLYGVWESKVIPMGYSYTKKEMSDLAYLFNGFMIELMDFLERDEEITHDDILEFLGHI